MDLDEYETIDDHEFNDRFLIFINYLWYNE